MLKPRCLMPNFALFFFVLEQGLFREDRTKFDQPNSYRSIKSALQYLTLIGPDVAFSVNKPSQFLQKPTQLQLYHWLWLCK